MERPDPPIVFDPKWCARCNALLHPWVFDPNRRNRDGLHSYCGRCQDRVTLRWRLNNPTNALHYDIRRTEALHDTAEARHHIVSLDRAAARTPRTVLGTGLRGRTPLQQMGWAPRTETGRNRPDPLPPYPTHPEEEAPDIEGFSDDPYATP